MAHQYSERNENLSLCKQIIVKLNANIKVNSKLVAFAVGVVAVDTLFYDEILHW